MSTRESLPLTKCDSYLNQSLTNVPSILSHFSSSNASDRKSGSAGMPRPISYAVFCLKKKNNTRILAEWILGVVECLFRVVRDSTSSRIAPTSCRSTVHLRTPYQVGHA